LAQFATQRRTWLVSPNPLRNVDLTPANLKRDFQPVQINRINALQFCNGGFY
jgi:hypothetical protein